MSGACRAARGAAAWLLGAVVVAGALPACAHERSVSYARFVFDAGGAEIALRIDSRDFTRLPVRADAGADAAVDEQIAGALRLRRGNEDCQRSGPVLRSASAGGRETLQWRVDCSAAGLHGIESALPQLLGTAHLCFVVAGSDLEVVLDRERPRWQQDSGAGAPPPLFDSFRLGVEHIAGGLDHLLFVFGLVVVAVSLSEAAVVITAFTVAHMLTLAAAALGLLRPPAAPVEALIALSIGLVAVENLTLRVGVHERGGAPVAAALVMAPALAAAALGLGRVPLAALAGTALFAASYLALAEVRPDARRLRWVVAFTFGLLHGFGFAGILVEAGFTGAGVMTRLVAFNAGVEAGQLVFVAMLWPLLALLRRSFGHDFPRLILEPASVVLLAASVAWYVTRTFG